MSSYIKFLAYRGLCRLNGDSSYLFMLMLMAMNKKYLNLKWLCFATTYEKHHGLAPENKSPLLCPVALKHSGLSFQKASKVIILTGQCVILALQFNDDLCAMKLA